MSAKTGVGAASAVLSALLEILGLVQPPPKQPPSREQPAQMGRPSQPPARELREGARSRVPRRFALGSPRGEANGGLKQDGAEQPDQPDRAKQTPWSD
jgi:hypothetical protein